MRIQKYCKILALNILLSACGSGSFTKVAKETVPQIAHTVASLSSASQNTLKNPKLTLFAKDTLMLPPNFVSKPDEFIKEVNRMAKKRIPFKMGKYRETENAASAGGAVVPEIYYESIDKFIPSSVRTVIKDEIFVDKKNRLYVPVEFYAKPNLAWNSEL